MAHPRPSRPQPPPPLSRAPPHCRACPPPTVARASPSVDDHEAKPLGEGQAFGEMELMFNMPCRATVKAETAVNLWTIGREAYRHVVMRMQTHKRQQVPGLGARGLGAGGRFGLVGTATVCQGQGCSRPAVHRRRRGGTPPLDPPPSSFSKCLRLTANILLRRLRMPSEETTVFSVCVEERAAYRTVPRDVLQRPHTAGGWGLPPL